MACRGCAWTPTAPAASTFGTVPALVSDDTWGKPLALLEEEPTPVTNTAAVTEARLSFGWREMIAAFVLFLVWRWITSRGY